MNSSSSFAKKVGKIGLRLDGFGKFSAERLDIRLYGDPELTDLDNIGPDAPLLPRNGSLETSGSHWLCCFCCCSSRRRDDPFKFDPYEKSEFGWFYADMASENDQQKLRRSIDRMYFASEDLSPEELKHLVEFFIDVYIESLKDVFEKPSKQEIEPFQNELSKLLQKHYAPEDIGTDEVVLWFTHEMPPLYVRRCTQLRPQSFQRSCPSCVIS